MLSIATPPTIYLHSGTTDMRKSFDGLSGIIRGTLGGDPADGSLFRFVNKRRDRIKALWWDGDGYVLWYKRLEEGTFEAVPSPVGEELHRPHAKAWRLALQGAEALRHEIIPRPEFTRQDGDRRREGDGWAEGSESRIIGTCFCRVGRKPQSMGSSGGGPPILRHDGGTAFLPVDSLRPSRDGGQPRQHSDRHARVQPVFLGTARRLNPFALAATMRRIAILALAVLMIIGCGRLVGMRKTFHQRCGWKAGDFFADPKVIALCKAIEANDLAEMDRLVKAGADVNAQGKDKMTPLLWAFPDNHLPRFKWLLEHGADPNVKIESEFNTRGFMVPGDAVTHFVCKTAFPGYFDAVFEHGGDPNLRTSL